MIYFQVSVAFSLGLERTGGFKTVAFCEIEPFCQRVLRKHWPGVPIYDDVRTLTAARLAADGIGVDVICGGFPCQDISSAGKKVGLSGSRSGLWVEYSRLVCEIRPRYVIVENVADLLSRGIADVLGDLAAIGYDAELDCISAAHVGAPHIRDRVWVLGYPNIDSESGLSVDAETPRSAASVSYPERWDGTVGWYLAGTWGHRKLDEINAWNGKPQDQPDFLGMDDGLPSRMDRLRALGNSVVPQIPELIGRAILQTLAADCSPFTDGDAVVEDDPLD